MTAKDFRDWEIYAELEPFGEARADHRAALIAQTVFNMAVAKKDRLPLKEFVLATGDDEERPRQTPDQQLALLKIMATIQAAAPEPTPVETQADATQATGLMEQVARARAAMR